MNGTPILDIKPYLPFTDAHPDASAGWTERAENTLLEVEISQQVRLSYPFTSRQWLALEGILAGDPRPHYHDDGERTYSFEYLGHTVRFRVKDGTAYLLT